jgi:hypothetical protein
MKKIIAIALVGMIGLSSGAFALGNNFVAYQNIQSSSMQVNQ